VIWVFFKDKGKIMKTQSKAWHLAHELTDAQKLYPPYKEAAAELR
jgi:hypothetical protein